MALVTSHTLNSSNGTHAGGIAVTLSNLDNGDVLFAGYMDEGGRLSETVDVSGADPKTVYEICFTTAPYWHTQNLPQQGARISDQIVFWGHASATRLSCGFPCLTLMRAIICQ